MNFFLSPLLFTLQSPATKRSDHGLRANDTKQYPSCFMRIGSDVKSESFISMLRSRTTALLILGAVVVNLLYKVSGEISPHENHMDNKENYDELNDKSGGTTVKLRVLVPMKNTFHEFVKVDRDPIGNGTIATGYSVDVFKEVMDSLPFRVSYEFFLYESNHSDDLGYYNELIEQLDLKRYDVVVGPITITSNRTKYGDFTVPYMMPGVSMIVPIGDNHALSLWWFLKPFTWDLWLLIMVLFLTKGLLVCIFEYGNNPESESNLLEQLKKILYFTIPIFLFEQWEKPKSKYSRLVILLWIPTMFVLVAGYGAILQTMLSSNNDGPIVTSIEQLIMNEDYVGYQEGSFVFVLLKRKGFQEEKLKAYSSIEEYETALSRGSSNNGVSAIVDEIPYVKVFLAKYADRYTMVTLTFSSTGFAFWFQRGCTIVPDVSRIILEFIEGKKIHELEKKWFGSLEPNASPPNSAQSDRRLSAYDLRGVLLITGPTLLIFIVVKISKYRKTRRELSPNGAVEATNDKVEESGQLIPNDSDIEARVPSDDSRHSGIAPQDVSVDVEMKMMSNSPAHESADGTEFIEA